MTDIGTGLICIANFALHHRIAEVAEVVISQVEKRGLEIPPDLHFRRVLFNLEEMVDGISYQQPESFKELLTSIDSFESILEDAKIDKYQFFRIQKAIVAQGAVARLAGEFLSSEMQEPTDPDDITVSKKFKEESFNQIMETYFRDHANIYQKHELELVADIRKFTRDLFAEAPSNTRKGPKRAVQKVLVFDIFASLPLEEFKQRIVKFFRQLIGRLVSPDPLGPMVAEFRSPAPLGYFEEPDWTEDQVKESGPYARHAVPPSPFPAAKANSAANKTLQSPDRKQSLEPGDLQAASRRFQEKYNKKDPLKDIKDIHVTETQTEEEDDLVPTQKQPEVGKKRGRQSAKATITSPTTRASKRLPLDAKRASSSKIEFQDLETQDSTTDDVDSPVQPRKAAKTASAAKPRRSRRVGNIDDAESEEEKDNHVLASLAKKVEDARSSRRPSLPPTLSSPAKSPAATKGAKPGPQAKRTPVVEDKNSSRTKWSYDEEEALREGVKRYGVGKWREIKSDPDFAAVLKKRDPVQLKDKYRNLWKKDLI
eukprot:gene26377-31872_t